MSKAFVDTTILTNVLLKTCSLKTDALNALAKHNKTELPVYAIKEFKLGPLSYFKYIHNKLFSLKSLSKTLSALQKLSATPQKYRLSTSLQAISDAAGSIARMTTPKLLAKYGIEEDLDVILAEEYRIAIKTIIYKAWQNRRNVTTDVVEPLSCYLEVQPKEERGLITLDPISCDKGIACCMNEFLKLNKDKLELFVEVIDNLPNKLENTKRRQVLRKLIRKPKENIGDDECRKLGDAIFVLYAPDDSVILTTNVKDHEPLANCLNKKVQSV